MEDKIVSIIESMEEYLDVGQLKKLQEVLINQLSEKLSIKKSEDNDYYLKAFLAAKKIEGCSERTIQYYRVTIAKMLSQINIPVRKISTDDIRGYLVAYQKINNCGNVTIDNIRRNISSFFSWLEEEDYILKTPMKRIHRIKTKKQVKAIISDEEIEILRDNCNKRELAIIDLL